MNDTGYKKRILDAVLSEEMKAFGCVVIVGPKMCGKTTTAEKICPSVIHLQKKAEYDRCREIANVDPSVLFEASQYPLLIDEWQRIPELWDEARSFIDEKQAKGMFIFTGSNSIDEIKIFHSGAGRISRLRMYTMSLYETEDSSGEVSLIRLFDTKKIPSKRSDADPKDVAAMIVKGGWPGNINMDLPVARRAVAGYCRTITESEVNIDGERKHDPQKMTKLLRSLSKNESTEATSESILKDVINDGDRMNISTLKKIYVVDNLPAWSPKLRSKTAVRVSDVRHLTDPSIAAYFLNASPEDLLRDPNTFGLLFESLVIRDLRVYSQNFGGNVYHYRDADGLEADAVIHTPDGRWAAFEVKLSEHYIEEAAKNLLKLKP